jgi:hypothetical protein
MYIESVQRPQSISRFHPNRTYYSSVFCCQVYPWLHHISVATLLILLSVMVLVLQQWQLGRKLTLVRTLLVSEPVDSSQWTCVWKTGRQKVFLSAFQWIRWPRGLRHELSSPTLRSWVLIPLEAWMFVCVLCAFILCLYSLRRDSQPT